MKNIDYLIKEFAKKFVNINNDSDKPKIIELYNNFRKSQLEMFSTKELMDELRKRGKTVGKKGLK